MKRRDLIKLGMLAGGSAILSSSGISSAAGYINRDSEIRNTKLKKSPADTQKPKFSNGSGEGDMPFSPLILNPFIDPLPIPQPLQQTDPRTWGGPAVNPSEHQIWVKPKEFYRIKLEVAPHSFSSSRVLFSDGTEMAKLPDSTIYGFNGTFPGPMIRATYGRPAIVRFENHLGNNPYGLDLGDFGRPVFLTHLHNGHSAPESDGNPFHRHHSYEPGEVCDNLYLNWPPDGDPREKQSFLWYHDHTHENTSTNVYKGMVGLYTLYDPDFDCGDETKGLRLPGFEYDIPMALYDCRLDDGVTPHNGLDQDGLPHPENLGKLFFGHYPNHGFVGDIFTVNGKAYPYLVVKRRKYRLRFLDCSIARWYELMLMTGTPRLEPGMDGQWQLDNAQQAMRFTLIAGDGGLRATPLDRNIIALAPAKRREVVVDFSRYMDGSPTQKGDVVYLCNILTMDEGRKPDGREGEIVPMVKIIIGDDPDVPDLSMVPPVLRELPPLPPQSYLNGLRHRRFELERDGDTWTINDEPFDPTISLADVPKNSEEVWIIENGGGGWVHPMHLHQEEHRVIRRDDNPPFPEDQVKEDVIALGEGEEVRVYRKFRTFTGRYVAHCHNLAHEDHAMMFGWTIVP